MWFLHRFFATSVFLLAVALQPALGEQALEFKLDGESKTVLPLGYSRSSVVGLTAKWFYVGSASSRN